MSELLSFQGHKGMRCEVASCISRRLLEHQCPQIAWFHITLHYPSSQNMHTLHHVPRVILFFLTCLEKCKNKSEKCPLRYLT